MKLNERGGSRTDTIVKLILVFFISLLSFSVGTFVGKQFSDSQHRLAALENEYNKDSSESRDVASIPEGSEAADSAKPKEILSNEDVAKLAEEFVQDKNADRKVANEGEIKEEGKEAKPEAKETKKEEGMPLIGSLKKEKQAIDKMIQEKNTPKAALNEKSSGKTPADKIAEGKAPLEAVKPKVEIKKVEKGLPIDVTGDMKGKYTIQVSSHQTELEAKARVDQLTGKGYVASYIPAQIDGKTWYRVGIGAFPNIKAAKDYLAKVKDGDAAFKGAIIRQIVQ